MASAQGLSVAAKTELREMLEQFVSKADAAAAADAIGQYVRDYRKLARFVPVQRRQFMQDRTWMERVQKAARRLDTVIAQETVDREGHQRVVLRASNPASFHALRVQTEIWKLLTVIDNAIPQLKLRQGEAGDPALTHLEAAVADVLDRIGIELKQGNSTLAAVLELIYIGIGKPSAETRDRNGARRAIKNLAEWRALPQHQRFML
jgi:hypothetical protein